MPLNCSLSGQIRFFFPQTNQFSLMRPFGTTAVVKGHYVTGVVNKFGGNGYLLQLTVLDVLGWIDQRKRRMHWFKVRSICPIIIFFETVILGEGFLNGLKGPVVWLFELFLCCCELDQRFFSWHGR